MKQRYPQHIRRNDKYYFEIIDLCFDDKFQSVNIFHLNGKFFRTDMITLNSIKESTYLPQPDELARFLLVQQK